MEITVNEITPRCKRVSFQDNTEMSFLTPDMAETSNLEISELFPNMSVPKPILRKQHSRQSFSPTSDRSNRSKDRKKVKKKLITEDKEPRKRLRKPLLPSKEPSETLAHALLRAMTLRDASDFETETKKSRVILPKIKLVANPDNKKDDDRASVQSVLSSSSRGRFMAIQSRNGSSMSVEQKPVLPEIIATPRDNHVITFDRLCGLCQRGALHHVTRKPAAGFCKICDEYLCANCVISHRGKLTKIHPVNVFYCHTCREMNILIRYGSGYCIQCKHFYCSVCIVSHCSRRDHDVLEGKDMLDVIDAMIGK